MCKDLILIMKKINKQLIVAMKTYKFNDHIHVGFCKFIIRGH